MDAVTSDIGCLRTIGRLTTISRTGIFLRFRPTLYFTLSGVKWVSGAALWLVTAGKDIFKI
jgi:hypothetical protein